MAISSEDQAYLNRMKQASIESKQSSDVFTKIGDWLGGLWNDFTGKTNNQMNLDFQRENLDYQKAIQKQIFEREDTAYKRTVNDMRAAGLNPVSMQGTNGSGEAIQTEAPEIQKTSSLQSMSEILNILNQVKVSNNNSTLTNAQADLLSAQADNQRIKNLWENDLLSKTISGLNLDNVGKKYQNEMSSFDLLNKHMNMNFLVQNGLSENMPESVKLASLMSGRTGKDRLGYKYHDGQFSYFDYDQFVGNDLKFDSNMRSAVVENKVIDALLKLLSGLNPLQLAK